MKTSRNINQTSSLINNFLLILIIVFNVSYMFGMNPSIDFDTQFSSNESFSQSIFSYSNSIYDSSPETTDNHISSIPVATFTNGDVPGRYNLPDHLRPSFESIPIWRVQLRVKTGGKKNSGTDDNVYVKLTNSKSSIYYLDKGGDDREKNKTNTYDIIDPNVRFMRDIKKVEMMIKGNDGWCVKSIEILINDVQIPVFTKRFSTCKWLDGNDHSGPRFYISGRELRKNRGWRYTSKNKALWLPPMILKRKMLESMVESYVGHMMNSRPDMKKLEYGKKFGRGYVQAKQKSGNKLKFDLDLAYHKVVDMEVDVDFDLVIKCKNNKVTLKAEAVKGKMNIPIISKLVRVFKDDFAKRSFGNISFGNSNVPFCPSIKVMKNGDISLRP